MSRGLLVAALALACGGGVEDPPPAACDPLADGGCPGGERCRATVDGATFCLAQQDPGAAACVVGSCAAGEACLQVEGRLGCHALCRADAACADGGECAYRLGGEDGPLGVCDTPCATDAECGPLGTCGFGVQLDRLVCVGVGPQRAGEACADARCGAGLLCLARGGPPRCEARCDRAAADACDGLGCAGLIDGFDALGYCPRPGAD